MLTSFSTVNRFAMYHCQKCGREVSAMEAVIKPAENLDDDNIVLCPICAESLNQTEQKILKTNQKRFGLAILISLGLVVGWLTLFLITASTWEVFTVFSGWIIGVYFNQNKTNRNNVSGWGMAVMFTIFVILLREWIMLSIVISTSLASLSGDIGLIPVKYIFQAFFVQISANPTLVIFWIISMALAGITANRKKV